MSADSGDIIDTRTALRLHLRNRIGRCMYRRDERFVPDRKRAFASYYAHLFREMRRPPIPLELVTRRRLDRSPEGPATWELRLRPQVGVPFEPGDMIRLPWRNRPETVQEVRSMLPDARNKRFRVWGDGITFCPPRRLVVDAATLLSDVLDLEVASEALLAETRNLPTRTAGQRIRLTTVLRRNPALANWRTLIRLQTRIRPRIYTIARLPVDDPDGCLSVLASERCVCYAGESAPSLGRCVAHLGTLEPGDLLHGHRMRHPHRLPCVYGHKGPGLAVVTGSAIAGVLAFLRHANPPANLWLIWGIRSREHSGYYTDELQHYVDDGYVRRLDIVESRPTAGGPGERVDIFLDRCESELQARLGHPNSWCYVSGQTKMGEEIATKIAATFASQSLTPTVAATVREDGPTKTMRLIVSTS